MNATGVSGSTVRLEGLGRTYGALRALDDLDLTISAGEFFTILGPSGSGKTTTLMLIAGFTVPTSGEIYIDDRAITRVSPHRRNIGVLFQNYGLFPHMSVTENIAFPLVLRGKNRADIGKKVDAMLELVQMTAFRQYMPQQLSGGQQQRVALARALVFRPSVLLLDEPLSALDKNLREQMQVELKELHRRLSTTVLCVTHDQSEALALSDRIAILNQGRLQQVDTPRTLYERPNSRFVATFVGESNIIRGRYLGSSDRYASLSIGKDLVFHAPQSQAFEQGDAVEIVIRPQHVLVGERATRAKNSYKGTIKNRIYAGDSLKLEIAFAGLNRVFARIPIDEAIAVEQNSGATAILGFEPENAMVYPASGVSQEA